jgi:hypothetical protein
MKIYIFTDQEMQIRNLDYKLANIQQNTILE